MPARAIHSIVLTGAPLSNTLNWDDSAALLQHPVPFITAQDPNSSASTCESPIRWRSLVSSNPSSSSSTSKVNDDDDDDDDDEGRYNNPTLFTGGGNIDRYSGVILDETQLSEFYEHSFALHEGLAQSQSQSQSQSQNESEGDSLSFQDDTTIYPPSSHESAGNAPTISTTHTSNLSALPNARSLLASTAPRTTTVNLIVAILHISPRRRVRTRWGRETDLIEVLVADDTSAGFRVTCWLPPSSNSNATVQNPLERSLAGLRTRDIVLFRCVALTAFRQRVYGQSLRYGMTRIDVLSRRPLDGGDYEGVYKWKKVVEVNDTDTDTTADRQLGKVRRVWVWIMNFIGPAVVDRDEGSLSGDEEVVRKLPPDTQ